MRRIWCIMVGMTFETAIRSAISDRTEALRLSNKQLRAMLAGRFPGQSVPSESKVDRIMRNEQKLTVQDMEMLSTVLDINVVDVLNTVDQGTGADFRCSVQPSVVSVSSQVRGSDARRALADSQCAHAA